MSVPETVFRYRWAILGLSLLSQLSAALAGQILAPLAPLFQAELGLTKAEVGIFSSATFAGAWVVILVAGSFTDRFGIRKMMSIGQVAAGVVLMFMALVGSVFQAAAVMFTAGLGRGMVFPGSTKAIVEWFPATARATAMGIKQTGAPIAGVVAAATLPALGLAIGWRSTIALVGIIVVAAGAFTALMYRDPPGARPVQQSRTSMRVGLKDVLRNGSLWLLSSIAMFFVMAQLALITYLALFLNEVVLVDAFPDDAARVIAAGGYLAVCQVGGITGRISWGAISDRLMHGRRLLALVIIGLLSAAIGLIISGLGPGSPLWFLAIIAFAAGFSLVGWNGVFHTMIGETVERKYAATSLGLSLTLIEFGTMMGPPLFGIAVDLAGTYRVAWFGVSAIFLAGTMMAVLAGRAGRRAAESSPPA